MTASNTITAGSAKIRNSSLELLRIISMVFIIMHHYAIHGGFAIQALPLGVNKILLEVLLVGGKLGVNCFVMITGYFMVNSKFSMKKLINLLCSVTVYCFIIQVVFTLFHLAPFSRGAVFESLLPVLFGKYWFATAYVLLFILSPFLNQLIHSMNQKMHFRLICVLGLIWCALPSLRAYVAPAAHLGWSDLDWTNLGWFIFIYSIAAYIRLYPNGYTDKCRLNFCMFGLFYAVMILQMNVFYALGGAFQGQALRVSDMNNVLLLFSSLTLFLAFKNFKMKPSKGINTLASTMFAVYLIHDNRLVRPFLWKTLFKNASYAESPFLFLHAFFAAASVFCVCVVLGFVMQRAAEKPLSSLVNKMLESLSQPMKKLFLYKRRENR